MGSSRLEAGISMEVYLYFYDPSTCINRPSKYDRPPHVNAAYDRWIPSRPHPARWDRRSPLPLDRFPPGPNFLTDQSQSFPPRDRFLRTGRSTPVPVPVTVTIVVRVEIPVTDERLERETERMIFGAVVGRIVVQADDPGVPPSIPPFALWSDDHGLLLRTLPGSLLLLLLLLFLHLAIEVGQLRSTRFRSELDDVPRPDRLGRALKAGQARTSPRPRSRRCGHGEEVWRVECLHGIAPRRDGHAMITPSIGPTWRMRRRIVGREETGGHGRHRVRVGHDEHVGRERGGEPCQRGRRTGG